MTLARRLAFTPFALLVACTGSDDIDRDPAPSWGVPISGGTMLVTGDGRAVVADADRDRVVTVDLASAQVVADVALRDGDEPGRLVEDGAGKVHIALRRGGAIVTVDPADGRVVDRREVCPEPRGLAWQDDTDTLHVACTGGELVSLPAAGGAPTRRLRLDRDLRDVVFDAGKLVVSRFRSAELLTLDASGNVVERIQPSSGMAFDGAPDLPPGGPFGVMPAIAWRTVATGDGRILISHQKQMGRDLETGDNGYGGDCGPPVETAMTVVRPGQGVMGVRLPFSGSLPVDVAVSPQGDQFAMITAGNHRVHMMARSVLDDPDFGDCRPPDPQPEPEPETATHRSFDDGLGAPTSIAYTAAGQLVTFYPEAPALVVRGLTGATTIPLPGGLGYDAGRNLFHRQAGVGMSCASCHPEGRDDGLIWQFGGIGIRRTQSLAGHLLARGPYHWSGDQADLPALMDEVFSTRMSGGPTTATERVALGPWLDSIPTPAPIAGGDATAIARGKALYDSAEVGCASCHGGAIKTNNQRFVVRAGDEQLKVPSLLGIAARPPFMHDGCATTLVERFGPCGGGDLHGRTSQLSGAQILDLVAYLETL